MRPSQPTRNLASRRLVFREPGACLPAMRSRSGSGRWSATGPGWKPPSSAISRGRQPEFVQALAGGREQVGLVGRPDLGGQRQDQAAGAATGVLAQLGDLHDGAEFGRLAQLALADRPRVWVAHRDEPVGDLLAGDALGDLFADLRGSLGELLDAVGCLQLGLGAAAASAPAQRDGQTLGLAQRPGGQISGFPGHAQRQVFALPGPTCDRAVQLAQLGADRLGAVGHAWCAVAGQSGGLLGLGCEHPGSVLREPEIGRVADVGLHDRGVDPRSLTTNRRSGPEVVARCRTHRDLVDHIGPQALDELADRRLVRDAVGSAIRQNRRRCNESETSRTSVS